VAVLKNADSPEQLQSSAWALQVPADQVLAALAALRQAATQV